MLGQDFGQRLRELRLAKGMTKEAFCDGDEVLSVRQLTRLETGKSQPKLETLDHLAHRLDISVAELLGEQTRTAPVLPAEYLKLKYQLIHTPSYDNLDVLALMDEKLGKILDDYYDDLPSEEQLVIDVIQSKVYSYSSPTHEKFGMTILEKNLPSLCEDRMYSVNDLILIQLYQVSLGSSEDVKSGSFDKKTFGTISQNLLKSIDNISTDYLFLLRDALFTIPGVEHERKEFYYTEQALHQLNLIMEETQDFQKKPILRMIEGQYLFYVKEDIEGAEKAYQEAILVAKLLGNDYLANKIAEEMKKDFENRT